LEFVGFLFGQLGPAGNFLGKVFRFVLRQAGQPNTGVNSLLENIEHDSPLWNDPGNPKGP
jgi:hypothetical protein